VIPKYNFIAWCRKLRDDLKRQLDALESGNSRRRERDRKRRKWVDTTPEEIERTKAQVAEIDGLLTGTQVTQKDAPANAAAPPRRVASSR
jgi:hypothetical protein